MAVSLFHLVPTLVCLFAVNALAIPLARNNIAILQKTVDDAVIFKLGDITYLANTVYPRATVKLSGHHYIGLYGSSVPITVISTNATSFTQQSIEHTIQSYTEGDDVFNADFLEAIYLASSAGAPNVDASALDYLARMNVKHTFAGSMIKLPSGYVTVPMRTGAVNGSALAPGPYLATFSAGSISLAPVYRLYEDSYRDFLFGTYDTADGSGSFTGLPRSLPNFGYPAIPVPSQLYYWDDPRPFAGFRVAVKDLFDMKGLITSGGSQAWAYISEPANETAPAIQRIVDLGGVLVGKFKLAQFASGANPWDWQDEHYPFNPRGDGWLTCSASSSGAGCSIAAYEWLDYAIDTAGVFSRDPYKWAYFAKHWYSPALHQSSNITGLSTLNVPNTDGFPKTILYPTDYLPLNNSAAEPILNALIANMSSIFGMNVKQINFTATVEAAADPTVSNLTALADGALDVIDSRTQWEVIAKPLITTWARLFDGRFPPIDPARREGWHTYNETANSLSAYNEALRQKSAAVEWYEAHLQYSTPESCSESVMLYDIGTGGLPSYREENLNNSPNASFLAVLPEDAVITGANICPLYGCADFTVPIGQVPYYSEVTFHTEMVPVTINMVVKRGCDFVLFNVIERLADAGVLKAVKTGKTAF